jgi:hypothetical protein
MLLHPYRTFRHSSRQLACTHGLGSCYSSLEPRAIPPVPTVFATLVFFSFKILAYINISLLPMKDFISLFLRMTCHQKYFKTVNKTITKMHDFIFRVS